MTLFKILAQSCGLSLKATTAFLMRPASTVESYWHGKRNAPEDAFLPLYGLSRDIDALSRRLRRGINHYAGRRVNPTILLRTISTPEEAAALGLPHPDCHEAMLARTMAQLRPDLAAAVRLQPSGPGIEDLEVR